jgi:predicted negative regulator of RcsB-dependent stress response
MKKYFRYLIISKLFLIVSVFLNAQTIIEDPQRWDLGIINESAIWKNLLLNYNCIDITSCWTERQQALMKVIDEFPNSQWADDALLMMACEKAIIDNSIDEAILELRKIQKNYPYESTIVDGWHYQRGCHINETWLMSVPGLVVCDEIGNVRKIYPFDRDSIIDNLEMETITFFKHLEKHPQRTKDVAQYIIALMLQKKGDIERAINELEDFLSNKDLRKIRTIDYEASKKPNGHLIESVPPFDAFPIWRVEFAACQLLLNFYSKQNENEKLIELSNKVVIECSPDGWYWHINKYLGDIYAKHNYSTKASEQYDLAIKGILERSKNQSKRMEDFYEKGLAIKPENFVSWEDEALKFYSGDIAEIKKLQKSLKE